jgi:ADP-heptose:LPS heptosyltransferase
MMLMTISPGVKQAVLNIYLSMRGIALTIVSLFVKGPVKRFDKKDIKKILVIRMDRLGDFIVTTPLLKTLRKEFPSARITLLARKDICELAIGQPSIDDVISYDDGVSISTFLSLAGRVRDRHFDLAIDPLRDYTLRTAMLAYVSRAPYRLGFDIAGRGVFFNLKVSPAGLKGTMAEDTISLAGEFGIAAEEVIPEIVVSDKDKTIVENFMRGQNITGGFLIGIHPGGYYPSQRWSPDNFAKLIDRLSENAGIKIILLGSGKEAALLKAIEDKVAAGICVFRTDSLNSLAAIIDRLKLFVGNNSGPLHMAAALGKRTVSTMGPTDSRLWQPSGKGHIVLGKELACAPCNRPFCREHECMESITVDAMFGAVSLQIKRISDEKR